KRDDVGGAPVGIEGRWPKRIAEDVAGQMHLFPFLLVEGGLVLRPSRRRGESITGVPLRLQCSKRLLARRRVQRLDHFVLGFFRPKSFAELLIQGHEYLSDRLDFVPIEVAIREALTGVRQLLESRIRKTCYRPPTTRDPEQPPL